MEILINNTSSHYGKNLSVDNSLYQIYNICELCMYGSEGRSDSWEWDLEVSKNINSSLIPICRFTDFHLFCLTVILLTFSPIRISVWVFILYLMNKIDLSITLFHGSMSCDTVLTSLCQYLWLAFVQYQHAGQLDTVKFSSMEPKWPCGWGRHRNGLIHNLWVFLQEGKSFKGHPLFALV